MKRGLHHQWLIDLRLVKHKFIVSSSEIKYNLLKKYSIIIIITE